MSASRITVQPEVEPITRAELKAHLQHDLDDDDTLLDSLIVAAREYVESWTRRALVQRTVETRFDCFPDGCRPLRLPINPVRSITSVVYVAADGTETTWPTSQWQSDTVSLVARLAPAFGNTYPVTRQGDLGAVRVVYIAGEPEADASPTDYAANVPAKAKLAVKLLAGHWFDHREAVLTGSISKDLEFSLQSLLWTLRITV